MAKMLRVVLAVAVADALRQPPSQLRRLESAGVLPRFGFGLTRRYVVDDVSQSAAPTVHAPATPTVPMLRPNGRIQTRRLNNLRDAQWLKGISADLTSAEFVVSMGMVGGVGQVLANAGAEADAVAAKPQLMKLEMLDIGRLRRRLERHLQRIVARREAGENIFRLESDAAELLELRMQEAINALAPRAPAKAKASLSADEAVAAAEKEAAEEAGEPVEGTELFEGDKGFETPSDAEKQALTELRSIALDFFRKPRNETLLRLFMREDGTVDWDSARGEVVNFGGELFDRLNGKAEAEENHGGGLMQTGRAAFVKLANADPTVEGKVAAKMARVSAHEHAISRRNEVAERLRQLRWEAAGEDDDGKYAARAAALRDELRARERDVRSASMFLGLATLDEQMEMACLSLVNEVDMGFMQPAELRLLVAEFGLLDAQLCSMLDTAKSADEEGAAEMLVEDAEVSVMTVETRELMVRLGLADTDLGVKLQFGPFGSFFANLYQKAREGLRFYWLGTKIIFNDVQYALGLIARAATTRYTLKPREVRTLRRTFKDILTFIPFVIILIIPLTPVGHVLVFSFIQRFFPDFFPSCYTDRRQNLLKIYDSIDKVDSLESELDASAGINMLNVVVARWPKAAKALRPDKLNEFFNTTMLNGAGLNGRQGGF